MKAFARVGVVTLGGLAAAASAIAEETPCRRSRGDRGDRAEARGEAAGRADPGQRVLGAERRGRRHRIDERLRRLRAKHDLRPRRHVPQQLRDDSRPHADHERGLAARGRDRRRAAERPEAVQHAAVRYRAHRGTQGSAGHAVRPQRDRRRCQHRDARTLPTSSAASPISRTATAKRRRRPPGSPALSPATTSSSGSRATT